ncbi:MAG TPA: hypothetical protein VNL14_16605 [Candidatus Acidoferrales bacterium]|nr:hypothetical protein [Candidatus Acidoferrales bacterium]
MGRREFENPWTIKKSKEQIRQILKDYGCDDVVMRSNGEKITVGFRVDHRLVKCLMPILKREEFRHYSGWQAMLEYRWQVLALSIEAYLRAGECGLARFEENYSDDRTAKTISAIRPDFDRRKR